MSGPKGRRLAASLVYDTRFHALPSGIRAVAQRGRRLLFTADEYEVVLEVTTDTSPRWLKMIGQVLADGSPVEGARVRLDGPIRPVSRVADQEGEFRFAPLPPTDFGLVIEVGADVLEFPTLSLAEAE